MVQTEDLLAGQHYVQAVRKAAAENDYNTLQQADGTKSDVAERAMSEIEGAAAPGLARIARGAWLESHDEKKAAAKFLALQYVRVPARREFFDGLADYLFQLQLAAGGPAQLREGMRKRGADPSDEKVLARWKSLRDSSWRLTMPREHHVVESLRLVDQFTPGVVHGYSWCVMRWERRAVLTCDSPVLLIPGPNHPPWAGVGILTAGCIAFAIARNCVMLLINKGLRDVPDGLQVPGTVANAHRLNRLTAHHARRRLYHHPADTLDHLLGADFDLPEPASYDVDPEKDADLRSALASMSEWAFRNPDQLHPMANVRLPLRPPPNAAPPASWRSELDVRRHLSSGEGRSPAE